jgi:hypothetical protein
MVMSTLLVKAWRCDHEGCGHVWTSKTEPKRCSKCKRPNWNRVKQVDGKPIEPGKDKRTTEEKVQAAYEKAGVRKPVAVLPIQEKQAAPGSVVTQAKVAPVGKVIPPCPECGEIMADWVTQWRCKHCCKIYQK